MNKKEVKIELLGDKLLIEQIPLKDEVRETGFTISAAARSANVNLPKYGFVIEAGPDADKVKKGDKVCFMFHSGTDLEMGDRKFLLMRQFDIAFIIKPE